MNEAEITAEIAAGAGVRRPGRALAEARAARNLTVPEVAQQLKLSVSQVDALEADAYDRLPGPVFVRGFVRNYARLLELDVDALVAAVELPHTPVSVSATVPLSRDIPFPEQGGKKWMPYALVLAVVTGALLLFEIFFSAPGAVVVSTVPPNPVVVSVPVEPATAVKVTMPDPASPAVPLPQNETAATPSSEVTQQAAVQPQRQPGMADLHFVFQASSWIEVRDRNNRILFSQLNPVGTEQKLQMPLPLSLVVGNAQDVRLTYNGQPFDLAPHTRVEVARFTLE